MTALLSELAEIAVATLILAVVVCSVEWFLNRYGDT